MYQLSLQFFLIQFYKHLMKKQKLQILQQSQIDESLGSSIDNEYIAHLKSQCSIRYNALKTAENLISAYQKENDSLKAENQQLRSYLNALEERLAHSNVVGREVEALEKTVLKYSQRINELLEKDIEKDHRIADLEREIRMTEEREAKWKEGHEERQRKKEREDRKRKQGEQKFNNYLKLPIPQDSFSSVASRSSFHKSSIQVLEQQVKKKDDQILSLLRRLRDVEDELKLRSKKERLKTSDTVVNNSIRKNTYSSIDE